MMVFVHSMKIAQWEERLQANSPDPGPNTPHGDDIRLVESLLRGDAAAWQRFTARYSRVVYARVMDVAAGLGCAGDRASIDDVTAEVFAGLLARDAAALRSYQGRASLVSYLAVIATRTALRMLRRSKRLVQAELVDEVASDQHSPEQESIRREEVGELLGLIEELPAKQQRVLTLFHWENKSYAEISDTLQMPLGSVGVTLKRAEKRLRELHAERERSEAARGTSGSSTDKVK